MAKMFLAPDADGYQSTDGEEVVRIQLEGGAGRYRTDKIGATKMVSVKWTLNRAQYQYWRAFYVTATNKGALPFICELVSEDGSGPADHTCFFIPGSVTLPAQIGLTYVQQAQLEAVPLVHNAANDESIMVLFAASGGYPDSWLDALARLVNVTAPGAIGG